MPVYDVTFLYRFQVEASSEEEAELQAMEKVEGAFPKVDIREVDE
jgi:hypothetical protein